jgi:hypothetical protein
VSGPHLTQSLVEANLDSAPPYAAVSYVWGDPTITHRVSLVDGALDVTESLYGMLKDMYVFLLLARDNHSTYGELWSHDAVHVWIDALCIEQQNSLEKGVQVPMITNIYSTAAHVFVYTGPEKDNSSQGINLLHKLHHLYINNVSRDLESPICADDYDKGLSSLPVRHEPAWKAARLLLRRQWPTRVWIVQEFVVNRSVALLCGYQMMMPFKHIRQVIAAIKLGKFPTGHLFDKTDPSDLQDFHVGHCLVSLVFLRYQVQEAGMTFPLHHLLCWHQRLGSSDPRDKVYALLSMATDSDALKIRPNYSPTFSDKNVYTGAVVRIIQHQQTMDILSGLSKHRHGIRENLPSWVGDWSIIGNNLPNNVLYAGQPAQDKVHLRASGEMLAQPSFDPAFTQMTITGSIVDTLIPIDADADADADADLQNDQSELSDTDRLVRIERTVMQAGNEIYHSTEGAREALVRSLMYRVTADGPRTDDEDKQSLNQAYDAWLLSKAPDSGILLTDKQRSAAQYFASGVSSASSGRRHGVASKGYICVLQKNMLPGEVIAVLEEVGYHMLCVLSMEASIVSWVRCMLKD